MFLLITDGIERGRKYSVYFHIITCLLKQARANLIVFPRVVRLALGVLRNKSFGSNIYQRIFRTIFRNISQYFNNIF